MTEPDVQGAVTDIPTLVQLRHGAKTLSVKPRRPSKASMAGGHRTRFRGRGMEFEEVRLYQPGDDIRTIDWGVTARTQKPHTKLFCEERERPVFVLVDQRASMKFGSRRVFKSVLAAEVASLIAWAGLQGGDSIGGLVFNDESHREVRPKRSQHSVLALIQQMDQFNRQAVPTLTDSALAPALQRARKVARPGSSLFIVSDFHGWDEAAQKQLTLLTRHVDVNMLQIYDPLERQLPRSGWHTISDGQQRQRLDTGSRHLREQHQRHFDELQDSLQQIAKKLGVPFLSLATAEPALTSLSRYYGSHERPTTAQTNPHQ